MQKAELKREIRQWSDHYQTRVGRELENAFPELEQRLIGAVEEMDVLDLVRGGAKKLTSNVIEPEVNQWVEKHATPLMAEAQRDLAKIAAHQLSDEHKNDADYSEDELTEIMTDMAAPIAAIVAGIGSMVAAVLLGIGTFLWFFVAINWPVLLGGLAVGLVLTVFGSVQAARLKRKVVSRFARRFIPKIRQALIGSGFHIKGEQHPSLRVSFQSAIRDAAENLEEELT